MKDTFINFKSRLLTSGLAKRWRCWRRRLASKPQVPAEALHDPDPVVRWRAVRRLAGAPQAAHQNRLFELLTDADPIIRDDAAATLASWGAETIMQPALALLAMQPAPDKEADTSQDAGAPLLLALLDLLARAPGTEARPAITPYLTHPNPAVCAAAARAMNALTRLEQTAK